MPSESVLFDGLYTVFTSGSEAFDGQYSVPERVSWPSLYGIKGPVPAFKSFDASVSVVANSLKNFLSLYSIPDSLPLSSETFDSTYTVAGIGFDLFNSEYTVSVPVIMLTEGEYTFV